MIISVIYILQEICTFRIEEVVTLWSLTSTRVSFFKLVSLVMNVNVLEVILNTGQNWVLDQNRLCIHFLFISPRGQQKVGNYPSAWVTAWCATGMLALQTEDSVLWTSVMLSQYMLTLVIIVASAAVFVVIVVVVDE